MSEMPKISVAIITYNQESFVRETLDSVLAQDYPNVEIVVGDDCSTDKTLEILKHYQDKHPNIILLSQKFNQGIAKNLNSVLSRCTGEYIAFLGGDDLFYPGKLSAQVAAMEVNTEVALSYHHVETFDSDRGYLIAVTNLNDPPLRNLKELLMAGISLPSSAVMIRRSCLPEEGVRESIRTANDWLLFCECVGLSGFVACISGIYGGYRIHGNNVTRNSLSHELHLAFDVLRELYPQLTRAVNRAESISLYREAYIGLKNLNKSLAFKNSLKAISLDPLYLELYPLFLISLLPNNVIKLLVSHILTLKKARRERMRV